MALERFTNKDEIIETNGPVRGLIWNEDDVPMTEDFHYRSVVGMLL